MLSNLELKEQYDDFAQHQHLLLNVDNPSAEHPSAVNQPQHQDFLNEQQNDDENASSIQEAYAAQQQLALAAAAAADLAVRHAEIQKAAVTALANANALALRRKQQRFLRTQQDIYQQQQQHQQPQQYQYHHRAASQLQTPEGQEFQNFETSFMSPMSGPGDSRASFALDEMRGFEDDEFSFTPLISPAMTPSYPFGPTNGVLPGNLSFSPLTSPALNPRSGDSGSPAISLDNPLLSNGLGFPTSSRRTSHSATSLRNQIAHSGSFVGGSMKRPISNWTGSSKKRCDLAGHTTQIDTTAEFSPQISSSIPSAMGDCNIQVCREHLFTAPSFSLDMSSEGALDQNFELQRHLQQLQPQIHKQHPQNQHYSNSMPDHTIGTLPENVGMPPAVLDSPLLIGEALYQQEQSSHLEQEIGRPSVNDQRKSNMPPPRLSPTTAIDSLLPVTPASLMHLSGKNAKSRTRNSNKTDLPAVDSQTGTVKWPGSSILGTSTGTSLVSPSPRPGTTAMSPHLGPNAMSQPNLATMISPSLRPTLSNGPNGCKKNSPCLRPMISPSSKAHIPSGTAIAVIDRDAVAKLTTKSNYEILKSGESTIGGPNQHSEVDEQRRTTHKAAEQKRRDSLKQSFANLRELLPTIVEKNPNKLFLLKKASEYIRELDAEIRKKDEEIASLKALVPEAVRSTAAAGLEMVPAASKDVETIARTPPTVIVGSDDPSPANNVADGTENKLGATNETLPGCLGDESNGCAINEHVVISIP